MKPTTDAKIILPRPDVFETKNAIEQSIICPGLKFPIYERTDYPGEGGIYVYYRGMPYPKKGFPLPQASYNNDLLKRFTLAFALTFNGWELIPSILVFMLLPWKLKMKTLARALRQYAHVSDWTIRGSYLTETRYSNPARAIRKVIQAFFVNLGVPVGMVVGVAQAIATAVEYDDAYRYRIQDIFSEPTKQDTLARAPFREIRRMRKTYLQREKTHAAVSIKAISNLASIAFLHPRIRKAWRKAILSIEPHEFDWLGLDNADRYHVLRRGDYDFLGKSFEERVELYKDVHRGSLCCQVKAERHEGQSDTFSCTKCLKVCEVGYDFPPEIEIAP